MPKYVMVASFDDYVNYWNGLNTDGKAFSEIEYKKYEVPEILTFYREYNPMKDAVIYGIRVRYQSEIRRFHHAMASIMEYAYPEGLKKSILTALGGAVQKEFQLVPEQTKAMLANFDGEVVQDNSAKLMSGGSPAGWYSATPIPKNDDVEQKARTLPGVDQRVKCPCILHKDDVSTTGTLFYIVIHLNDDAGWDRNKIADWIDKLHDEGVINAEFSPWNEGVDKEDLSPVSSYEQLKNLDFEPVDINDNEENHDN